MRRDHPTDEEIADFIDGRLVGSHREEVERWLANHPDRRGEVERQRQLNAALQGLGAEILDEPIPERLRHVLEGAGEAAEPEPAHPPRTSRRIPGMAVGRILTALVLLAVGGALGWVARDALAPQQSAIDTLLADASHAYAFYSQDRDHRIEFPPDGLDRFSEVSKQMFERSVEPPDLAEAGYEFQGARIAPTGRQTSTFFFFEDETGEGVTVILWPNDEDAPIPSGFRTLGKILASFWFSDGFGYAVMGEGEEPKLRELSDAVVDFYGHQLDGRFSSP